MERKEERDRNIYTYIAIIMYIASICLNNVEIDLLLDFEFFSLYVIQDKFLAICRFFILNLMLISHIVLSKMVNSDIAEILHRPIRSLTFPENSNMGVSINTYLKQ